MPTDDNHHDEHDHARRRQLSAEERLELVERDLRSHARSLTVLTNTIKSASDSFSDKQLEQLKEAVSEAFAGVGLRVDDPDHIDDAREDFRFLRRFRQTWDGAANKVGGTVLVAIVGVALTIIGAGFWAWLSNNLPHK
jgi:hypothetical protein